MRRLALVLTVLVCGPASAQDDSHLQAAKAFLAASYSEDILDVVANQANEILEMIAKRLAITEEEKPILDKFRDRVNAVLKEEISWQKMEPRMAELYAEHYSEEELDELTQFYLSPIGRKVVERTPELARESWKIAEDFFEDFSPRLRELHEELEAELRLSRAAGQ